MVWVVCLKKKKKEKGKNLFLRSLNSIQSTFELSQSFLGVIFSPEVIINTSQGGSGYTSLHFNCGTIGQVVFLATVNFWSIICLQKDANLFLTSVCFAPMFLPDSLEML